MEELLKAIAGHLEFFGHTAVLEDGVLKVTHPQRPYFWVIPSNEGALFRTLFRGGPAAQNEPAELASFLNRANAYCVVARYVYRENFLSFEAWFPNCYEKASFAAFFTRYSADLSTVATLEPKAVDKFFPGEGQP